MFTAAGRLKQKARRDRFKADPDGHIGGVVSNSNPPDVQNEDRCEDEETMAERHTSADELRQGVDILDNLSSDDLNYVNIEDKLRLAEHLAKESKFLAAATILERIHPIHYQPEHQTILKEARKLKEVLDSCRDDYGWRKLVDHHGKHNFTVEFRVDEATHLHSYRIATPLEASLMKPVISVTNETQLFSTWIPQFNFPRVRVSKSGLLIHLGKTSHISILEYEFPWPIGKREALIKGVGSLDTEPTLGDEQTTAASRIIISIETMDSENDGEYGLQILPKKNPRVCFSGGMIFEKQGNLVLFTLMLSANITKKCILPTWLITFNAKIWFPRIMEELLQTAEEVKAGKRPAHIEAIEHKRELYDWVEESIASAFGMRQKNVPPAPVQTTTSCLSLGKGTFFDAGVVMPGHQFESPS